MTSIVKPTHAALPHESLSNGCFETMRAYGGKIFRLDAHLDRLYASAQFLQTPLPKRGQLRHRLLRALEESRLDEAVVRVALLPRSKRVAPSGLLSRVAKMSLASIVVQPVYLPSARAYRKGVRVAVVPARKFPVSVVDPQAKYSARLGSIMAVIDAQLRGVDEALFTDATGYVTESTASNFCIVRDGVLLTSPCWLGLLSGITRDVLDELAAALDFPLKEQPLTRHDLYVADEAFLTSTLKEVLPITCIDGRQIGNGRPGPMTQKLLWAFRELVHRELS